MLLLPTAVLVVMVVEVLTTPVVVNYESKNNKPLKLMFIMIRLINKVMVDEGINMLISQDFLDELSRETISRLQGEVAALSSGTKQ